MEYSIKQVILMRTKFPDGKGGTKTVRTGKLIAQGAHASMKVFFDRAVLNDQQLSIDMTPEMTVWYAGSFAKVVLGVESEQDLLKAYHLAWEAGIPAALIQDAGNTEFHGIPTYTAVAIGPAGIVDIDKITGRDGQISTRLL